ncbi:MULTISPECIES: thiol reductant ABC exporter subunit CydD [unclassified Microbacterium]|uniref:thiol reductant ABC exporter subunit CydD n=1 Tax=unclassified Microbacterium TaxID=2609290 RepID=UPI00214CF68F|nr:MULTISPECIES: thiol reductant ABC exporter subunit CydD [unclassified Microbacterium]MCR2783853.1 thiol reductant ABC exporter subunit CydD [Microbacterium sp. zg.B96]WIM15300.1 thiol reductant ABC exporter subunit CydD [Microbacterium sp. zg-B96]
MASQDAEAPPRAGGRPLDPRLLTYARASRAFFFVIGAIGLAQTLVIVAFAWLLTRAIVGAIDGMPWGELSGILAALAGVVALRALLLWLREVVAARASARVQAQLRANLVEAVDTLGPGWLARHNSAHLAVTAGRGLDALDAYFARYLPQLVQTALATPLIILVMWWMDWVSGLTVVLTIPLIPFFMILIGMATRAVQDKQWQTLRQLAARFADTVRGLSTLTVFGRQHRAVTSIQRVTERYRDETMRVLRVSFLSGFALELLASLSVAIIAVSIGFRLLDGELALLVGLFVLLLAPEAYLPLRQVGVQFHAAAEGISATNDVFAVLDEARAARRATATDAGSDGAASSAPEPTTVASGVLVLRDLRVRYGDRVLPPVDLVAHAGELVLLEGASGAGKSSVFAALRGAAEFDGEATLGGTPVTELSPHRWLGWAGQRAGLIAGTIADNVALGDDTSDSATIHRALDLACAEDLNPDYELGVQGAGLSGGQAQRVAVARAIHRQLRGTASVLALDEPSAALDAETEERLWLSLRRMADQGAIVLLISHRTTARAYADRIVRLDAAEVPA